MKGGPFVVILPTIQTTQDVDKAAEKVTQAMARGKVTPTEGVR